MFWSSMLVLVEGIVYRGGWRVSLIGMWGDIKEDSWGNGSVPVASLWTNFICWEILLR